MMNEISKMVNMWTVISFLINQIKTNQLNSVMLDASEDNYGFKEL